MRRSVQLAVLSTLLLSGCIGLPSSWKFWGTPLTSAAKTEAKLDAQQAAAIGAAQEAAHKTAAALPFAPPSRPVEVARDFAQEARSLLDQVAGAPKVGDEAAWRDLVSRLLSENEAIRLKAENERREDAEEVAELSAKLARIEAAKEASDAKVAEYAKDNERLADIVRKFYWIAGGLAALWLLSQVLTFAARLNPALAPFAGVVNAVAAPALARARARAVEGLEAVGKGLREARQVVGTVAERVVDHLDANTDREHQAVIARAAKENS